MKANLTFFQTNPVKVRVKFVDCQRQTDGTDKNRLTTFLWNSPCNREMTVSIFDIYKPDYSSRRPVEWRRMSSWLDISCNTPRPHRVDLADRAEASRVR